MHQSYRNGFEKSAYLGDHNPPMQQQQHAHTPPHVIGDTMIQHRVDPESDIFVRGGHKIFRKGIGYVVGNATHSRAAIKATNTLADSYLQKKRLQDDNPEPVAPLAIHDGVF